MKTITLQQLYGSSICQWKCYMLFSILLPVIEFAQHESLPWFHTITPGTSVHEIETISAQADVMVSDGLSYQTKTVYHDPQRAIFQRVYKDSTITQGVEGKYIWSFDGKLEKEVPEFIEEMVLGHQLHAQILFFDKLHPSSDKVIAAEFNGQDCYVMTSQNENSDFKFYYRKEAYPLGMEILRKGEENIIFKFDDWRNISGIDLPHYILIDDGNRLFHYRYKNVKFNSGSMSEFRAPEDLLTEKQKLIRQHRVIMDGHYFGLTAEMKSQQSDTMIMISGGEIYTVQGNQPEAMIDRIMASRDYTVYDDIVKPTVEVSDDGSLAWVIAKLYAEGIRYDENGEPTGPLEFTCSWIELYEKVDFKWKMKGIVSTFLHDKK